LRSEFQGKNDKATEEDGAYQHDPGSVTVAQPRPCPPLPCCPAGTESALDSELPRPTGASD